LLNYSVLLHNTPHYYTIYEYMWDHLIRKQSVSARLGDYQVQPEELYRSFWFQYRFLFWNTKITA